MRAWPLQLATLRTHVAELQLTEVAMATQSSSDPADSTGFDITHSGMTPDPPACDLPLTTPPTWLRQRLRVRLERHIATDAFCPALTVVGFRGHDARVLRRGVDHPEDAMLGFVLPAEYQALGVLASSVVATPPRREHHDAALAIGIDRNGQFVSLLATQQGVTDTYRPQGWLADACLRAVGLPTPASRTSPLAYPVALWLDRLMVAILASGSSDPLRWVDAAALCPVPRRWRSHDAVDLGTTLGSTARSWKALHGAAIEGSWSALAIEPAVARWMDEAMFARWCMGVFPDLTNLRGDVEFLAPADVAENVEVTLRAAWLAFAG